MKLWYPWIQQTVLQDPQNNEKKTIFSNFHILHVGQGISEKQYGSTMTIEGPQNIKNIYHVYFTMWSIYLKSHYHVIVIVVH